MEGFFHFDYPEYELIFCVAEETDPAVPAIREILARHPRVPARLFIGEARVGPNPKINNMLRGYEAADHDWILISDSNVRVGNDYLRRVAEPFADDVGIVTAVVSGQFAATTGAWLESVFLNTFYARFMMLSKRVGVPIVVGKSMLFRKSDANRFGGIANLGRYLAEDYMAGQAMKLLGLRVEIMKIPIVQPIGSYTVADFWARHIRWGRIRKSQAPQLFFLEPLISCWIAGLIGSVALTARFDVSFRYALLFHLMIWGGCDLWLMSLLGTRIKPKLVAYWLLRETLHLPLWAHIASGSHVHWRGRKLTLARGGILRVQ